jgi:hypothetical protein
MSQFENIILKNSKLIISFFGFVFIITFITFLYVVENKEKTSKSILKQNPIFDQITISPSQNRVLAEYTKAEKVWVIGKRVPNTTEVLQISAQKETEGDNIAIVRFRIEGGKIVNITSPYILLQSCNGASGPLDVCIDIVKPIPFIEGEIIASVTIEWTDSTTPTIFKSSQFGYYNGTTFNSSN